MFTRTLRVTLAVVLVLAVTLGVPGCGGGILGQMLRVTAVRAFVPSSWSSSGGMVKILADISGYTAVTKVIAMVKKIGDTEARLVELTPTSDGKFEGAFQAEENASPAAPEEYTVTVTATDGGSTAQSEPVSVEVPPTEPGM